MKHCSDCLRPCAALYIVTTGHRLPVGYHRTRQVGACCYREDGEADGALRAPAPRTQARPAGERGVLGLGGGR